MGWRTKLRLGWAVVVVGVGMLGDARRRRRLRRLMRAARRAEGFLRGC